jgi:hypothetical protein
VTRNGQIYWDLQKYDIKMRTKHMSLIFRNLFNGDKALGKSSVVIIGIITSPTNLHGVKFTSKILK